MFTGIIENMVEVKTITPKGSNIDFEFKSDLVKDFYIDQSISHNGVCLTIVGISEDSYTVTAIQETLEKTNLGLLKVGEKVNIERAMLPNTRMDGHFVQGHVDTTAECIEVSDRDGSWLFGFKMDREWQHHLVSKGSVCLNGVSLTVVDPKEGHFCVAIIPYTYAHTNFNQMKLGNRVNIEFDILGKYILKYLANIYPSDLASIAK